MTKSEPDHYRRYRLAWESYADPDTPKKCKEALEKEMDSAQNDFKFDEFQEFKETLPGYTEHWNNMKKDLDQKLLDAINREFK